MQVNHGSSNDIELTEDDLVTFFEPVVASILHLATSQINKIAGPANGGGSGSAGSSSSSRSGVTHATRGGELHCNKMLLVGGFASSPYLQGRLQGAFQSLGVQVVVPDKPYAAVLSGEAARTRYRSLPFVEHVNLAGHHTWGCARDAQ